MLPDLFFQMKFNNTFVEFLLVTLLPQLLYEQSKLYINNNSPLLLLPDPVRLNLSKK